MTAIDMIREGFYVWADTSLGENVFSTPIVFTLLFLFGFLVTAVLKSIAVRRGVTAKVPAVSSREATNWPGKNKLRTLESELAASDAALKRLTDTLSTTFAHLSGGMAVFDVDSSLHVFNPAICDLFDLDSAWLANRPTITDFISKLRENRFLPEKKNFLAWRKLLTGLVGSEQQVNFEDNWVLPDGRVLRVTAKSNVAGTVAFFFEDISRQVAAERQFRVGTTLNQCVLDRISDAVVIFDQSGAATLTNKRFKDLFGQKLAKTLADGCSPNAAEFTGFWSKLKAHASIPATEADWAQMLEVNGKQKILTEVSTLSGGATLAVFRVNGTVKPDVKTLEAKESDPIRLEYLAKMLSERDISLDHSGLHLSWRASDAPVRLRRILWYLVIAAANDCRKGGQVTLSSDEFGLTTKLFCRVSDIDRYVAAHENVAANLLEQATARHDAQFSWVYDRAADPLTVSYKQSHLVALAAV